MEEKNLSRTKRYFVNTIVTAILLGMIIPMVPMIYQQPQTSRSSRIGILGKSSGVQDLAAYISAHHTNFNLENLDLDNAAEASILLIGEDVNIGQAQLLSLTSNGVRGFCVMGADSLFKTPFYTKTSTMSYAYNLQTKELVATSLTEGKIEPVKSQYMVFCASLTNDGVQRTYTGSAVTHDGLLKLAKQGIDDLLAGLTQSQSSGPVVFGDAGSEWIRKWEDTKAFDQGFATECTRYTVYRLLYPDDAGYEFWRIDPYVQQHITDYTWTTQRVGHYVNSTTIYADASHGTQSLYTYGPTGTQTGSTTGYDISFSVSNGGVGIGVSYSSSWDTQDVTTVDQCDQYYNYALWNEAFSNPDYGWWPTMDWCRQPALVARTSFYSQPSLVIKTTKGNRLYSSDMYAEREYFLDHDFYISWFWVYWTRDYTWTYAEWWSMSWFPYRLCVNVYDRRTWPLANMQVQVFGSDGSTLIATKYTDWSGFTYFDLNYGSYKLVVSDPSNAYTPETRWTYVDKDKTENFYLNKIPNVPSTPSGPTSGYRATTYTYSSVTTDGDGDNVCYQFDWGDGQTTTTSWYTSGTTGYASHAWSSNGLFYVKARAEDSQGAWSGWSSSLAVNIGNRAPNTPSKPSGTTSGYVYYSYSYSTSTTDPDGDNLSYQFDWGDGTTTTTGWYGSGSTASASHSWSSTGTYSVKARAQDTYNAWGSWSPTLSVSITNPPGGGGGGCPYVFAWNGHNYVKDNNLLPASETGNGTDTKDYYKLEQPLIPVRQGTQSSLYSLQIREFENETDYIDQVKLMVIDHPQGTNIAVTPEGEILTYTNPTSPTSCIDNHGINRLNEVGTMNGNVNDPSTYFQGYEGDWLVLDFGKVTGPYAKLILRDDQKCCDVCINVQILDSSGNWQTVEVLHPRDFWGIEAVNMAAYAQGKSDFKVRLLWTATHRLDYVGLDTSPPAQIKVSSISPTLAVHSTLGDVRAKLLSDDEQCVKLVSGQQVTLTFLVPNTTQTLNRDFIFYTNGYYYTTTN
jgi:hypothetical protein